MGKRILFLTILAAFFLTSCQKSGVPSFTGSYSFKTGGYVTISGKYNDLRKGGIVTRDTAFTRNLLAESGQMHIVRAEGDAVKLTMNITGGNPVVFDGTIEDNILKLAPTTRQSTIIPEFDHLLSETVSLIVKVDGIGRKYDNMLVFSINYEGDYKVGNIDGKITESEINCIAVRNE